ncbi:MAG: glycosyltransferase family 4 protein [Pirellulales bacterium]|nr:glycosyltransferase family 4 protein [Pirellulales bacterium]
MKILNIVGDSEYGGGSFLIQRLSESAIAQGWEVDVLTTNERFQNTLKDHGIGIVDLDVIWRPIRPFKDLQGACRLVRFLKNSEYNLIHTHTSKAGIVGRWAAHKAGMRSIVHTVHGFAFHEESKPLTMRFYSMMERMAARWCDKLVTVSDFHRQWALRLGIGKPDQVISIPNGIPPSRVEVVKAPTIVRKELGITHEELLMLSTGRLARQKGLEYLLESIILLEEKLKRPYRVILAGDGPLRSDLQSMVVRLGIQHRVKFLGFREDVGSILAMCDIVVLPSLWEGLSIALLEAMAAGKPIVTTTIGSNKEVTRNGEAAILIPTKDPKAIADAIVHLVHNPTTAASLAKNGRNIYYEGYTEERMLKKYMTLYEDLISQKGSNQTC